jgi:hypothetical protein
LNEAQWRKETGQKTAEETILADLGITIAGDLLLVKVPPYIPVLDGTVETFPVVKELDIAEYFPKELIERATVSASGFLSAQEVIDVAAEAEARHNAANPPVEEL